MEQKQNKIREIMEAEYERRERLKKYYRNLLLYVFGCMFMISVMVLFGKEFLIVTLVGLAIGFIGAVVTIACIIRNS